MIGVATFSTGSVLPESVLHHDEFAILAAFVAINTLMYGALAVAKMMPKIYASDLLDHSRRGSETRSIHPGRLSEPKPGGYGATMTTSAATPISPDPEAPVDDPDEPNPPQDPVTEPDVEGPDNPS